MDDLGTAMATITSGQKRRPGRPKGAKNTKTLAKETRLKEALTKCGEVMMLELEPVLKAVIKKAKEGDVSAAKLILDRTIPSRKAIEHIGGGNDRKEVNIVINVEGEKPKNVIDAEVVSDEVQEYS